MRTFRDFWRIVEVLGSSLSLNKGTGLVVVNPTATGYFDLGEENLMCFAINVSPSFSASAINRFPT